MQQNVETVTKLLVGNAGQAVSFIAEQTGDYVIVIGENSEFNVGGGTVAVSQDGIDFDGMGALAVATRKAITMVGGRDLSITLGGGATGASIKVGLHKIGSIPRVV